MNNGKYLGCSSFVSSLVLDLGEVFTFSEGASLKIGTYIVSSVAISIGMMYDMVEL